MRRIWQWLAISAAPDVIVCGDSLAAVAAVLACKLNGYHVHWVRSRSLDRTVTKPESGFDSLSPEGVRYVHHLLGQTEVDQLGRGSFAGVNRNGTMTYFDHHLGCGMQIEAQQLKAYLIRVIPRSVSIHVDTCQSLVLEQDHVRLHLCSGKCLKAAWIIDGQGELSQLPRHGPLVLSPAIWIERSIDASAGQNENNANRVEFFSDEDGWRWYAYDKKGMKCVTQWRRADVVSPETAGFNNNKQAINCYWYKRPYACDGRLILVGSTFSRLDPCGGIGMTQHLMSALEATKLTCVPKNDIALAACRYHRIMTDSFHSVAEPMKVFYAQYGLTIVHEPTVAVTYR